MRKGWNIEYLDSQIKKYKELCEHEQNLDKKQDYDELSQMYSYLYTVLFLSDGEVVYSFDNTEEFLKEINGIKSPYTYPTSINHKASILAKEIMQLSPIKYDFKYSDKVTYREATDLIYEFLKEHFDISYAQIFEKYFLKKRQFVLLDKTGLQASVNVIENDLYIEIPKTNNIPLASAIAHEAGHIRRIVENDIFNNDCILNEFESFTYEIRFLIWLIQNDIHKKDSIKYLLALFKELENGIVLRYFNNKYKLTNIKSAEIFEKKCESLNINKMCGLSKKSQILDVLYGTLDQNILMYFLSYIAAINELTNKDYLRTYECVIAKVGVDNGLMLAKENNINFTDLTIYKTLRREMLKKL